MMRHLILLSILVLSVVIEINGGKFGGPMVCRQVCRGRRTSHCVCIGCCMGYGLDWGGFCSGGICHCNGYIGEKTLTGRYSGDSRPGMDDDGDMYNGYGRYGG